MHRELTLLALALALAGCRKVERWERRLERAEDAMDTAERVKEKGEKLMRDGEPAAEPTPGAEPGKVRRREDP